MAASRHSAHHDHKASGEHGQAIAARPLAKATSQNVSQKWQRAVAARTMATRRAARTDGP